MPVFTEDPWSRIVAVHWKDDGGPTEPPVFVPDPPYCGRYGYGAIVAVLASEGGLTSTIPYGPDQLPPMIGTFSTTSNTGPGGARYGGLSRPLLHPVETMTASAYGLIATNIVLDNGFVSFTDQQLMGLQDANGNVGTVRWNVPMATGHILNPIDPVHEPPIPIVIKSYTVNVEWVGAFISPPVEVGIAISHPIPGWSGVVPQPTVPLVVFGETAGGSGSFFYDFKYASYGSTPVTPANQFDPLLGGPAWLWWMTRRVGMTAWSASSQFMANTIGAVGNHYTWEIVAACQITPSPTAE